MSSIGYVSHRLLVKVRVSFFGQMDYHIRGGNTGGHGVFSVQDRRLWERAFEASINGAVRAEEAVEPDIATIGIAKPNLAAEPGIGNVMRLGIILIDY